MRLTDRNTENIRFALTEQGYLMKRCHIARTGPMDYEGSEIGRKPGKMYPVETTAKELFDPETIRSYENMPVSMLHPEGLVVDSKNWKDVAIGHLSNVAPNPDGIHLDADVLINDASAIEMADKDNIRQLSCGQDADIVEGPDGKLYKRKIRGNHVAVVPSARAGVEHRLGDERKNMSGKHKTLIDSLRKVFGLSRKLNDEEVPPEDKKALEQALAELQAALEAMPEDALPEEVEALKAQIAELQDKLDKLAAGTTTGDEDPAVSEIDELKKQVADLTAENEALRKENEELKAQKDKDAALADAKARFPKARLGDAKTAREVYTVVLSDAKAFVPERMEQMSDTEIRAAYAGLCASRAAARSGSAVGKKLLGDSGPRKIDMTQKFGGKK